MARWGRRRGDGAAADEGWPEEGWPGEGGAPGGASAAEAPPAAVEVVDLRPAGELRPAEARWGGAVGAVLVVAGIAMLVDVHGAGAPRHPSPLWPAATVAAGIATLASLTRRNRVITALVSFLGGFVASVAKVPNALSGVRFVAFLAPAVYAFWIFRRQSKADRARRQAARASGADRARTGRGSARQPAGARGRAGTVTAASRAARPTGRYTPPKQRRRPGGR